MEERSAWSDALMEESETWGLDALHTLAKLAVQVGRSYLEDPVARAALRIRDHYYDQLDGDLPQPYGVWLARVSKLLAAGQRDGSISPGLDCDAVARVVVASFYGVQDMSNRLNTRTDLLERIDEWWTTLMPILSAHGTRGQKRHLQKASSV